MNLIQLQPDDVLVITVKSQMSQAQQDTLRDTISHMIGERISILVLAQGESLEVLRGIASEAKDEPHHSWTVDGKPLSEALAQREVQHVDTDEQEATGIPPHVWLYRNMLTDQQLVAPLGRDETNGQYAVSLDDLTDDQRAIPHVAAQLPKPFYPPVPYEHFWMRKGGIPSRFLHGKDLVFWGDEVAYPWADMQETARVGRTPGPATLPENNTST